MIKLSGVTNSHAKHRQTAIGERRHERNYANACNGNPLHGSAQATQNQKRNKAIAYAFIGPR